MKIEEPEGENSERWRSRETQCAYKFPPLPVIYPRDFKKLLGRNVLAQSFFHSLQCSSLRMLTFNSNPLVSHVML